jgi:2-keto-3-deoxy-galactonokinase
VNYETHHIHHRGHRLRAIHGRSLWLHDRARRNHKLKREKKMFYVTPMVEDTFEAIVEHHTVYNAVFRSSSFLEAQDYALGLKKSTGSNYTVSELIINIWATQTIEEAIDEARNKEKFAMGVRLICEDGETRLKDVK